MGQQPISNFPRPKTGTTNVGNLPIKLNQPFLLDMITLEYLYFQNIPESLDIEPSANWKAVLTPGRNLANYKYANGEDTISFSLDWYSNDISRKDVLSNCKWIEALTRNNGYDESPHTVMFGWGKMFTESRFIVFSAPYRLSLSSRQNQMLPTLAVQEVTLKRISEYNPLLSNIKSLSR